MDKIRFLVNNISINKCKWREFMDKFSFKHIFFLICSVAIASFKTYPEIFINVSGRDSWICTIIASLIAIAYFDYIINICVKNNCYSIVKIFTTAFGNIFGKVFLWIFIFGLTLSLFECASIESDVIHTNLFLESPTWYILLFIVIPALYVVKNGRYSLMIVIMICIIISIFNGINLSILTEHFKDYRMLFPVFKYGVNSDFLICIIKIIGLYSSISIVLPYLSQLKSSKSIRKYALFSNLFVVQMIIVATIGVIATFNVRRLNDLVYPKIVECQLISYFGFIANGEFYVIFQVISSWFAKYITSLFAILLLMKELKLKKLFKSKVFLIVISFIVYISSYLISKNLITLFKFLNIYIYLCIVIYFIIPILAFTIFNIRNKKNCNF